MKFLLFNGETRNDDQGRLGSLNNQQVCGNGCFSLLSSGGQAASRSNFVSALTELCATVDYFVLLAHLTPLATLTDWPDERAHMVKSFGTVILFSGGGLNPEAAEVKSVTTKLLQMGIVRVWHLRPSFDAAIWEKELPAACEALKKMDFAAAAMSLDQLNGQHEMVVVQDSGPLTVSAEEKGAAVPDAGVPDMIEPKRLLEALAILCAASAEGVPEKLAQRALKKSWWLMPLRRYTIASVRDVVEMGFRNKNLVGTNTLAVLDQLLQSEPQALDKQCVANARQELESALRRKPSP